MPQSHENAHEVVARDVDAWRATPPGRVGSPQRRRYREASKLAAGALRWHLLGDFHRHDPGAYRPSALCTIEDLEAIHTRRHKDRA